MKSIKTEIKFTIELTDQEIQDICSALDRVSEQDEASLAADDLFKDEKKEIEHITTTGVDGLIEPLEHRVDFSVSDKDFESISKWYLSVCEKRELLGNTNHLLYICKKA